MQVVHAFGVHPLALGMAEGNERGQALLHRRAGQAVDDDHVQLDGVGRVVQQLLERGVADAEVIDCHAKARLSQGGYHCHGVLAQFGCVGFGQLDLGNRAMNPTFKPAA